MSEPPWVVAVEDLEKRWRPLAGAERGRAEVLIGDAVDLVRAEARSRPVRAETVVRVVCQVVKRAMTAREDAVGVSQMLETTGPFTQQLGFSNPDGDMYLTSQEKRSLGAGRQTAFAVMPRGGG